MPFSIPDDWETHLYNEITCPDNVIIPVDDGCAWKQNPGYRWVYNKMNLCTIQGLNHGPHGINPNSYPVFSKPIYNLWGMGMNCQKINSKKEINKKYFPGHFWMEILEGEHISLDLILVNGKPKWWSRSIGIPDENQTFDYWIVNGQNDLDLSNIFDTKILNHFSNYTGHMNIELIGNTIIEIHLRLTGQFVVFYGKDWLNSIVSLYEKQKWYPISTALEGYSVPVFVSNDIKTFSINNDLIESLKADEQILDIQICLDNDGDINGLANPLGGSRIAIVNSFDLDKAKEIRSILQESLSA